MSKQIIAMVRQIINNVNKTNNLSGNNSNSTNSNSNSNSNSNNLKTNSNGNNTNNTNNTNKKSLVKDLIYRCSYSCSSRSCSLLFYKYVKKKCFFGKNDRPWILQNSKNAKKFFSYHTRSKE